MKIKLGDIVGNSENLQNLLKTKLPVKVAYRLKRLSQKLEGEIKTYNETRNALVLEIAKDLPDPTKITAENQEELQEYNKRHNELLEMEVEIDFEPISIDDLGEVEVAPNELISWIFA